MDKPEEDLEYRLSDKDGKKDSDGEAEREVSHMFEGYNMGLTDKEDDISPPKLEFVSQFRPHHSPPPTIDISSVRYRPVPVMAQAVLTYTYSHPRQELLENGKVNT